ncbi:MAG: hypothetical protein AW06_003207 [Candidatus Accumulibacter cognatus]|uniref:Uncharacterized protein n=1 Tax=Candidatus Accumulibacter cognatus TaxID=2954383 RepID=A0A080M5H7_9PROT|nr:MAG: hypothetical protein AW06_003207 [Candidatus Accumulibacter cognatus]
MRFPAAVGLVALRHCRGAGRLHSLAAPPDSAITCVAGSGARQALGPRPQRRPGPLQQARLIGIDASHQAALPPKQSGNTKPPISIGIWFGTPTVSLVSALRAR